jgi:selenocysteine-specific elongation factor
MGDIYLMHVIGTAGHVDHGKSTLVSALTGINPDRLKEEQAREMTIDLGFAWLNLPGGELVGIVDVPGHQDFIENMLAGVGGIDAVLFVIAADEGIMPQTREHLAILDLLQIKDGVIALTKIDSIEDTEWLDMVEMDIRQAMRGTILANAPLVRVSARTGAGLDVLKQTLSERLAKQPERANLGRPRLPVDRAFSIHGFGAVVTGTLLDGEFHLGDEVVILPSDGRGRIRGLQTHKNKVEKAIPGSRTAINIAGIDLSQVKRGDVISLPDNYQPTGRLDAYIRVLPGILAPIQHGSDIKFFIGASEQMARLRLLDSELLQPGQEGWVQLEFSHPVVAVKGDRFILRRPSPGETIGGGVVVEPHPKRRHKRFSREVLDNLQVLKEGSPEDILFKTSLSLGAGTARALFKQAGLILDVAQPALARLIAREQIIVLPDQNPSGKEREPVGDVSGDWLVLGRPDWDEWRRKLVGELNTYHLDHPLKKGMPKEAMKSRLKLSGLVFHALIQKASGDRLIIDEGITLKLPDFEICLSVKQQEGVQRLMAKFAQEPYSPPLHKDCVAELGDDLVDSLVDSGQLIAVSPEVVFRAGDFGVMVDGVKQLLQEQPLLTLAQVRDRFCTSRRYAQALLEYLDQAGITVRDGDSHRLKSKTDLQPHNRKMGSSANG